VIWVWIGRSEILFAAGVRHFFRFTKRWYRFWGPSSLFFKGSGAKVAGVWRWPLTYIWSRGEEWSYTPISLICLYRGHRDEFTVMCHLATGIRSEKCVVRRFSRCANVIGCTYRNVETWNWLGLLMDGSPFRHLFPEHWGFIHIEDLLWQVIFLHNQLF